MRLFTAIELTEDVRAAVIGTQQELRRSLDRSNEVRWVRSEHLHLTLTFMPAVDPVDAGRIGGSLARPIVEEPFQLMFGGIGVFPEWDAPRVVWLGITKGVEALRRVHEEVAARLDEHGVPKDPKPFTPHLTLGRWRHRRGRVSGGRVADLTPETQYLRQFRAQDRDPSPGNPSPLMQVESVTLFESRLSSSGPSYTALCRTPLRCR
jgi:2'-5' RNA ligase